MKANHISISKQDDLYLVRRNFVLWFWQPLIFNLFEESIEFKIDAGSTPIDRDLQQYLALVGHGVQI